MEVGDLIDQTLHTQWQPIGAAGHFGDEHLTVPIKQSRHRRVVGGFTGRRFTRRRGRHAGGIFCRFPSRSWPRRSHWSGGRRHGPRTGGGLDRRGRCWSSRGLGGLGYRGRARHGRAVESTRTPRWSGGRSHRSCRRGRRLAWGRFLVRRQRNAMIIQVTLGQSFLSLVGSRCNVFTKRHFCQPKDVCSRLPQASTLPKGPLKNVAS